MPGVACNVQGPSDAGATAEHARIKDRATIEWGPEVYWYGCREFSVLDPDGHSLTFSSPTSKART